MLVKGVNCDDANVKRSLVYHGITLYYCILQTKGFGNIVRFSIYALLDPWLPNAQSQERPNPNCRAVSTCGYASEGKTKDRLQNMPRTFHSTSVLESFL